MFANVCTLYIASWQIKIVLNIGMYNSGYMYTSLRQTQSNIIASESYLYTCYNFCATFGFFSGGQLEYVGGLHTDHVPVDIQFRYSGLVSTLKSMHIHVFLSLCTYVYTVRSTITSCTVLNGLVVSLYIFHTLMNVETVKYVIYNQYTPI